MQDEGERHSVDVTGRRQHRRVDVGVSVDPDDTEVRTGTGVARDGPDCEAVVSSEHDALTPGAQRLLDRVGNLHRSTAKARGSFKQ